MSSAKKSTTQQASPVDPASPEERVKAVGNVESKIPGRMRVRLKPELRTAAVAAKVQKSLEAHPDVRDVSVNERTGSVVFTHAPEKDGHSVLSEIVEEAELMAAVAFDIPSSDESGEGSLWQARPTIGRPRVWHRRVRLSQDGTALSWAASRRHTGRRWCRADGDLWHLVGDAPRAALDLDRMGHLSSRQQGATTAGRTCAGRRRFHGGG